MTAARITVGILTFRRPEGLASTLPLVLEQVAQVPGAEVLVVDNDSEPSARDVVDRLREAGDPVRYVHEPEPGIVAGRNRALDEATGDVLIFLDDDERPSPGWLDAMLGAHERFGGAGVVGPVLGEIEGELDPWIAAGRFFERKRYPTGTVLPLAGTGNLLLDLPSVREHGTRFDDAFRVSGGSDTAFTSELTAAGGRLFWCDEAAVLDVVPAERATRRWVLRRAFRSGNSRVRVAVHQAPSTVAQLGRRARGASAGVVRIGGGALRAAVGTVARRPGHQARGVRTAARGAGMVAAAFGGVYEEYRR
ncbi:glycosyltransferase family 2 protein [Sanguibacter sp. HDW7]|uniref:glycosyltransferase family 2 protein n=1 Tax=Sanguibacter sp. HDW7 TaxID=2714931 RepID=UPI001F0F4977|nr:glycosyltransferase family 2 protein [Sanguibacter sp. HDW7]